MSELTTIERVARYGPKPTPPSERLWKWVQKTDTCWNWMGFRGEDGYGRIGLGLKSTGTWRTLPVHRVAYELLVGPVPDGLVLDHLCRNRRCVNPDHLEPVTERENILRGTGYSARNAAKTHCPKGHEYTPENTITGNNPNGRPYRKCRACSNERDRIRGRKRRQRATT